MPVMKQQSLGLGQSTKRTRRREFLSEMERVVPWTDLVALVSPYMPEGRRGRPPFPVEVMLRIHFMQQWFNLSDPAMEDALHDVPLFREFAGLGGWDDRLPDESTILRFRHLLEKHKLAPEILKSVNDLLQHKGLLLKAGTVVDATLIAAPSSTKNATRRARPGDEAVEEGQPVVLRDEGAHRRRCRIGPGAHGARHGWQRQRRGRGQQPAARAGRRSLG